jgi:hypothetical protein
MQPVSKPKTVIDITTVNTYSPADFNKMMFFTKNVVYAKIISIIIIFT